MKKNIVPNSFVEIIICTISGLPSEIKEKNEFYEKLSSYSTLLVYVDIILSNTRQYYSRLWIIEPNWSPGFWLNYPVTLYN